MEPTPWTLDELSRRVQAVLVGIPQDNGQVSEVPNARTIRYYTTIGLLERPRLAGRTATYGRRHLEQIVAIKRLQAQGLPLAQVQERLLGLDPEALAKLAALPADVVEASLQGPVEKTESRRERSFWGEEPADAETRTSGTGTPRHAVSLREGSNGDDGRETHARGQAGTGTGTLAGVQFSDGVTLAFPAGRAVTDDDMDALRAALLPVVEMLRARGLIASTEEGEDT